MLASLRRRSSYANVMATIAVFIALGGSSYAVGQISGSQIKNRSIGGKKLKRNTVAGTAVKESSLGTVPAANTARAADTAARADTAALADRALVAANITAPEGFHEIGAPGEPAFIPPCVRYSANPSLQTVGFYKDREGVVHLRGAYSCTSAGEIAFNLPRGYRPAGGKAHTQAIACFGGGICSTSHTTLAQVLGTGFAPETDGGVIADATIAILDGISFRAGS
jgi:hypothetical protein